MSKFCVKCGKEMDESARSCPNCGAPTGNGGIQKRDIAMAVVLSIVTCGIYSLYWLVCLTNESNTVSDDRESANGGLALLYTIITCGIYGYYWNYKMGKKLYEAGKIHGVDISDNSVLYLVLAIFGLSIVNYCLIQSDLNRLAN